ncbi:MAG: hypothetical protein JWR69_2212 [Pedosphaera sp.]|nr:hypothetical protein [Pedosphaera sp.]
MVNKRENIMTTENQTKSVRTDAQNKTPFAGTIKVCRNLAAKVGQLKARVMETLSGGPNQGISGHLFQQAVGEAEALAWSTSYPLLFLPVLAEEKVLSARQWTERQRQILERQRSARMARW